MIPFSVRLTIKTIVLLLLAVLMLLSTWLCATEDGLNWVYQQISVELSGEVIYGQLSGRLIGPISIDELDYEDEKLHVSARRVELDWSPLALLGGGLRITRLHGTDVKVEQKTVEDSSAAAPLPEILLPWRVQMEELFIDGLRLSRDQQQYRLYKLGLSASLSLDRLAVEDLQAAGDGFSLDADGNIQLSGRYLHLLNLRWQATLPSGKSVHGEGRFAGNLDQVRVEQQLSGALSLQLDGELLQPLEDLHWRAGVRVDRFNPSLLNSGWPVLESKLSLKGSGNLTTMSVTGEASGDQIDLKRFSSQFALQRLVDGRISIERFRLKTPATKSDLKVKGLWTPPQGDSASLGEVALKLDWRNLRWPMQGSPWFDSAQGTATVDGGVDDYRIDVSSDRPWPQAPPSQWRLQGSGNRQGMDVSRLTIDTLDGDLSTSGRLDWSEHFNWRARITASQINPGLLYPDWPGSLQATLNSRGRIEQGGVIAELDIADLHGRLRDNPLTLSGQLFWARDELSAEGLQANSGVSSARVNGRLWPRLETDWSLKVARIDQWLDGYFGELEAKGHASGAIESPLVQARFNARDLRADDYQVGHAEGSVQLDPAHWQKMNVNLASEQLSLKGYQLQSLSIDGDTQNLVASASAEQLSLQLGLRGEMDGDSWQGVIEQADIQSRDFSDWRLQTASVLRFDASTLRADALCWVGDQGRICADIERRDNLLQSKLELSNMALKILKPWLPAELSIDGNADAEASIHLQTPEQLTGSLLLKLPAGRLLYPLQEGEAEELGYQSGELALTLDQQALKGSAQLALSNGDRLEGRLSMPGLDPLRLETDKQMLAGSLNMSLKDFSLLQTLLPEVQQLKAGMALQLEAKGTLARPQLSATALLDNGSFRIPRLGLSIDRVHLKGQSDELESFHFELAARSGDGMVTVHGQTRLDPRAGWPTSLSIKGDGFDVSRIKEARVRVSPDLKVDIVGRSVSVNGEVFIPYAKLQPKDVTTATRLSDDVVFVGADKPAEPTWRVSSRVRVRLGDRVQFFGYGFDGKLDGRLLLEESPGQPTRASGDIRVVSGKYKAYGQNLDIEQGRLLFSGGPLVNPGLDVSAVRHVNEVTAGIRVSGTLQQPKVELFSIPVMGQTDMLSYLLLGRPIENATNAEGSMLAKATLALSLNGGDRLARLLGDRFGFDELRVESSNNGDQASLVIGRYLSPRLYVSYGVGLIEAFNTINVRYRISDKWQLKAESGEYHGADLLYTIER